MSNTDERTIPMELFQKLNDIFLFDLDAAATRQNSKCYHYYDLEKDGLVQDWSGHRSVFVNPPYSRGQLVKWVRKAASAGTKVVMLLPSDISTNWFYEACSGDAFFLLCKGRLKFNDNKSAAKFGTIIAMFGWGTDEALALQEVVPGILF